MDNRNVVKTGDVLLFSGNTPTGFLLRTFVSSEWNHSGIAIRFITVPDESSDSGFKKIISLTDEGELYVFETNTGRRKDDIFNCDVTGAGFSRADWAFDRYNRIAVRQLSDRFRTPTLAELTLEFANKYYGNKFPSSSLPFISVWLGIPLVEKDIDAQNQNEMFCSELMAHYYSYCIGPQYEKLTGFSFNGTLSQLFGNESPKTKDMFTPGHFTFNNTPNASIFIGKEKLIYVIYADVLCVILQPLLLVLIVALVIWMTLPEPK